MCGAGGDKSEEDGDLFVEVSLYFKEEDAVSDIVGSGGSSQEKLQLAILFSLLRKEEDCFEETTSIKNTGWAVEKDKGIRDDKIEEGGVSHMRPPLDNICDVCSDDPTNLKFKSGLECDSRGQIVKIVHNILVGLARELPGRESSPSQGRNLLGETITGDLLTESARGSYSYFSLSIQRKRR